MNTWKVILATLVIFGAGVVTGGLLVNYSLHGKPVRFIKTGPNLPQIFTPWQQRSRDLLRRMDRDLDLTPEQHQRIERLLLESSQRTETIWKPITPQMRKETQRLHREMRDVLSPDQRKLFDELFKPRANQDKRHPGTNQPPLLNTNSAASASTNH